MKPYMIVLEYKNGSHGVVSTPTFYSFESACVYARERICISDNTSVHKIEVLDQLTGWKQKIWQSDWTVESKLCGLYLF